MGWWRGVLCFFAGLIIVPLVLFLYLDYGRPPVAVSDAPFPMEKKIVGQLLHARIDSNLQNSPIQSTPEGLAAGAVIYKRECAFCHGLPQHPSSVGANMYPNAPQLWKPHGKGVVGVSDDPVGETYWRVDNGIRLTGMPSYKSLLSEDQMWQVSLLLASAAKPLPQDVQKTLAPQ